MPSIPFGVHKPSKPSRDHYTSAQRAILDDFDALNAKFIAKELHVTGIMLNDPKCGGQLTVLTEQEVVIQFHIWEGRKVRVSETKEGLDITVIRIDQGVDLVVHAINLGGLG